MSAKHTPGPWVVRKMGYEGHSSGAYYIEAPNWPDRRSPCVAHIKQSTIQPMEANARLIAAAPELLEAWMEYIYDEAGLEWLESEQSGHEWDIRRSAAKAKAIAAIAKVTGVLA